MSISINAPVPMGVANKLPIGCTQTQDENPYLFRKSGGSNNANVGNKLLLNKLIGGTVAWNQHLVESNAVASYTKFGLTFTRTSGKFGFAISGTTSYSSGDRNAYIFTGNPQVPITNGHVYFVQCNSAYFNTYLYGASWSGVKLNRVPVGGQIAKATSSANFNMSFHYGSNIANNTAINETVYVNLIDLTLMFGSTIADYVYTLESGTAGAGIAWLKSYGFFTALYYAYDAGSLQSVKTSAHKTVGFNQFDKARMGDGYISNGTGAVGGTNTSKHTDYIRVIGGSSYYIKTDATSGKWGAWYDANKTFILGISGDGAKTAPNDACYMRYTVVNNNNGNPDTFCINLSKTTGSPKNGDYVPYEAHEYALDDVELRGILKKDANNNLRYDGDEYTPDGVVTRKFGIVDLGTLAWTADSGLAGVFYTASIASAIKQTSGASANLVCAKYVLRNSSVPSASNLSANDKQISSYPSYGGGRVFIIDTAYAGTSATDFKTAMSGVYLIYELATPTTETADPYTKRQNVSKDGTEQFVDAGERDIEMPVQHETVYPIATLDDFAYDAFPMSLEESGRTQYPMEITSQNIIVG